MALRASRERILTAGAIALIVIGCTIGILVPAGLGWDFGNFYDAGHRVAAGQVGDLYHQERAIAGRAPQGTMHFWGAPLSAVFVAPLGLMRPGAALIAFKLQNSLALLLALFLLYRHCRRYVVPDQAGTFTATFAILCLLYQPFWTIFRVGGQTTPTVFLLLVLSLLAYTNARFWISAPLIVAAAIIKPTLATLALFLVCVSAVTFNMALAVVLAGVGLFSIATLGWSIHLEFLRVLVEASRMSRSWEFNSSLYVPFENFRLIAAAGSWSAGGLMAVEWILRIAMVALFVRIVRRSRRETPPGPARRHVEFLMAICFWLLTSQVIWEHYLTLLFLPLAYVVAVRDRLSSMANNLVWAIFALSLGQNLILVEYVAGRLPEESTAVLLVMGILKAGPLILLATLLWRHDREIITSLCRAPLGERTLAEASAGTRTTFVDRVALTER